ncbi:EVE domain-containing protein [Papiliotrema laurentii]|uniref:EVE domain-containing protein n=1 Tax=Papiliotrema laurentii TaxID=5418 RepID=A0AAD9CZB7_PAPLA|nr:EVE domain-containing protein [Papiliotrema laurentii]
MAWLMKAEPDSRVVKGKDVKFSIDDFEKMGVSPWDGVRNHEAKNIMKTKMKVGDKVLFYHSNCKVPGVFALAEVAKEGYPDYTAWDESHPYFDAKSDKDNPTWYMVDVRFTSRLTHPPTLALIKHLTSLPSLPAQVEYISPEGLKALKEMPLVNRGRLSVQPVSEAAYEAVVKLGTKGGWDDLIPMAKGKKPSKSVAEPTEEQAAPPPEHTPAKPANKRKSQPSVQKGNQSKVEPQNGERRSKRIRKQS